MKRIVLLTNEMTPYRKSFYDRIYNYCCSLGVDFKVLTMTRLQKGYNWNFDECMASYVHLMKGVHISFPVSMHINIEVYKNLRRLQPNILIMAGSYVNPTSWFALNALKGLPCKTYFWSESHLNEVRDYNSLTIKIRDMIRRKFYSKFTGFWYAGKLSKEFIEKFAQPIKEMHFVPNLIENERYYNDSLILKRQKHALKTQWDIAEADRVAIIPARLSKEKGIDQFFRILHSSKLKDKLTVIVPGIGPMEKQLKEISKELGLKIKFVGYQQQPKMIELYSIADFLILPSLSDPNPLTCVESLWCGLPLYVSTHVGNHPEVVDETINGYVFSYNNENDAVLKLERLISASDQWYADAATRSYEIARQKYNPEIVVKNLINNLTK